MTQVDARAPEWLALLVWYVALLLVVEYLGRRPTLVRVAIGTLVLVGVCCALAYDQFGDQQAGDFAQVAAVVSLVVGVEVGLGCAFLMRKRLRVDPFPRPVTVVLVLFSTLVSSLAGLLAAGVLIVLVGFGWFGTHCC